jgi:hypothetical protein
MDNLNPTIQEKLASGGWGFHQLPTTRDDATMWQDVKTECNFSSPELSELKNTRCPAAGKVM